MRPLSQQHRLPRQPNRAATRLKSSHNGTAKSRHVRELEKGAKAPAQTTKILEAEAALKLNKSLKRQAKNDKAGKQVKPGNRAKSSGETPFVTKAPAAPADLPKVTGFSDQTKARWIKVSYQNLSAVGRLDTLLEEPKLFYRHLLHEGLLIATPSLKAEILNRVQDLRAWPVGIYVATHPGFHNGAWVFPDSSVVGKPLSKRFQVAFGHNGVPLARAGSLAGWQQLVRLHADRQPVALLALGVVFGGMLVGLMPGCPNVGIELTGETSTGKSTVLSLAASALGAPLGERGSIALPLRTTLNGLERQMLMRHGVAFCGDEANLLGRHASLRSRGQALADLVFLLGEGVEKARFNDLKLQQARFAWLITSNRSIAELLHGEHRDSVDPVLVRLITVPSDAGTGHGVYHALPKGFADSGAAINALREGLVAHHGHAAAAFAQALVKWWHADPKGLEARIAKLSDGFVKRCNVDPADHAEGRRAKAIGMLYAGLRLAYAAGVLPMKHVGEPLLACYARAAAMRAQSAPLPTLVRVRAYSKAHRPEFIGLGKAKRTVMKDAELDKLAGIKARRDEHNVLLMRPARWKAEFGADADRMLVELEQQGRLQATDGRHLQTPVRRNKPKDRMYAIVID